MAGWRVAGVTISAVITLIGAAGTVRAQGSDAPIEVPVQVGPLALAPTVRLTDFGYDSNANNKSTDNGPQGDFTARLSPAVDAWLRLPHVRVNGRSQFDFYYYKQLTDLRALDTNAAARVDLPLNRLTPFFAGALADTRHRQELEIDAIAKRRDDSVTAGADLRLTAKISAGVFATRSRFEYAPNSLYLGVDLGRELNHRTSIEGIAVRYALTPYTRFSVQMEQEQDRFDFNSGNNADVVQVIPSVEFDPHALVSGRASIGFLKRTFRTGGAPNFSGTSALVNLNYTLLGQTRFTVEARRELQYSYVVILRDYLVAQVTVGVTHRLGESWDVGGSLGRARLSYSSANTSTNAGMAHIPDETLPNFGADLGYRMRRMRVGLHLDYLARNTDLPVPFREYRRLRIGSTLTYAF